MSYAAFSFTIFSLPLIFILHWWPASISHFLIAVTKFSSCSSNKKMSPFSFLFLALDLGRSFPRWATLACRLLSLFLYLTLALCSKFVDMTINLSLILKTTRIEKQFSLPVFVFNDSLVVSALQDAGGYAISSQSSLELHLGCHTSWLSFFYSCGADGRALGRCTVTRLPNFLGWVDLLSYRATLA